MWVRVGLVEEVPEVWRREVGEGRRRPVRESESGVGGVVACVWRSSEGEVVVATEGAGVGWWGGGQSVGEFGRVCGGLSKTGVDDWVGLAECGS